LFFFSSRRRHTRLVSDWSSDVCSSDLLASCGRLSIGQMPRLHRTAAVANRPQPASLPACPTSRQRFHFYVAHPAPGIVEPHGAVSPQALQIAREPSGVGNRERTAAVAELAKVYGLLRPLPGSFLPACAALPRS